MQASGKFSKKLIQIQDNTAKVLFGPFQHFRKGSDQSFHLLKKLRTYNINHQRHQRNDCNDHKCAADFPLQFYFLFKEADQRTSDQSDYPTHHKRRKENNRPWDQPDNTKQYYCGYHQVHQSFPVSPHRFSSRTASSIPYISSRPCFVSAENGMTASPPPMPRTPRICFSCPCT